MTTDLMQRTQEQLAAARQELLTLLHSLTSAQWGMQVFSEGDNWDVTALVTHLAEGERGMSIQVHKIRKGEETVPENFDLNRWNAGVRTRMGTRTPAELFALLEATRERTLATMASLRKDEWSLTGRHPSRGVITIAQYYETMAAHDRLHAQDIRKALNL
jgi:uncharacterized protein (TIGR03083 family)